MRVVKAPYDGGLPTYTLQSDAGLPVVLADQFLEFSADHGRSPNTVRAYAYDLQYLFRFLDGAGLSCLELGPRHMVQFLRFLRSSASRPARRAQGENVAGNGRGGVRLSDATVRRVLSTVSIFYEFLIVCEMFPDENPLLRELDRRSGMASAARRPAMGRSSRQTPVRRRISVPRLYRLPRPIPRDHVELLLQSLNTERDRAIFLLCVNGGLRPAEALTLRLPNIHYGLRRVVVDVVDGTNDPRGLRTKSRTERTVDLDDGATLACVSRYVMRERPREAETDIVFLVGRGGPRRCEPLSYAAVNRLFARHMEALGLRTPETTPHALRHTHATEMWEHGMREMALQKRLGHASPESTKVYTRVSDPLIRDEYRAALESLARSRAALWQPS